MEHRNPYAPPQAEVTPVKDGKVERDGKVVVVYSGSDLPPRCITCNAPVKGPVKEVKLYWHTPWLYLLILVNILFYAIVGLVARRSVKVSPGLCEVHAAKRRGRILLFVGTGGVSTAIAIFLMMGDNPDAAIAFFALALLTLIVGMLASRKVHAREITKEYARVGGCKEPFLASLE